MIPVKIWIIQNGNDAIKLWHMNICLNTSGAYMWMVMLESQGIFVSIYVRKDKEKEFYV